MTPPSPPEMVFARRHQLVLELALLALVGYLAALGVTTVLGDAVAGIDVPASAPTPPASSAAPPAPLAAYAVIAERDIFNPPGAGGDARAERGALRLWGVAMHGEETRAVIEDAATRRQELYRVGDRIGTARVAAIGWDRVTVEHPWGEEQLLLEQPAEPAEAAPTAGGPAAPAPAAPAGRIRQASENVFVVDRRELAGAVDNLAGLMGQLRAVAEVRDGRPAGFRVFQIRDDSLFARLGLRNGDVVKRVNGTEIAEPAALLAFLERLRSEPRVALEIVRGEAPRTLVYDLR